MSFTNLYYQRTAGTAKACYVCYKPTTTVLATVNTVDFLYTCPNHLTDPGFASAVGETGDGATAARKMGMSPEEIAKIKAEWEEKQKKKQEKEKEKERAKEKKKDESTDGSDEKDKDKRETDTKSSKAPGSSPSGSSVPTPPTTPTHQRFTLHRDYFAMRLSEHRKRRQAAQAKELAPRLPGAPRGNLEPL